MTGEPGPRVVRTAAAIAIGNELLSGKVREGNLHSLAQTLRALGVELRYAAWVNDDEEAIAGELNRLRHNHDVVFTSGGIGPTHDDVTIAAVARAFALPVETHPVMAQLLEGLYGAQLTGEHLRMALVPRGAELMTSPEVQWPTVVLDNVWVLPGVPEIFRMKLQVVREHLVGPEPFVSRAVYTQLEEAELKPALDSVVAAHPAIEVGSYPKWFDPSYRTKVTFDGRTSASVEAACGALLALLPPGEPQRIE